MSENREAGWYWCKDFDHPNPEYWECMYWSGDDWEGPDPMVVGPRIPTPDDPWQTVPMSLTRDMRRAFSDAHESWEDGEVDEVSPDFEWACMLSVAPKPGGE